MKVAIALFALLAAAAAHQATQWGLGGTPRAGYTMVSTSGSALDRSGATIALRGDSAAPAAFGTLSTSIAADSFRVRRVRVVADIETKNLPGGASPWLRADGPNGVLALENGTDAPVRGTGSGHREVTVYVPAEATRLLFGLLATGPGEATARSLRIVAGPPISPDTPLGAEAARELDSAIGIVRAGSLWRDTVTWAKVLPEVRAVAAGSETAVDAYPAIRLLLTRLGDHHSFIMKPSGAQQFQSGGAQNPRPVVKALADRIGYISVPAYSGAEPTAMRDYVQRVQDSLGAVLPQTDCKWVVDLRGNGGGNMWPMLGGLRPFFGDAGLGSFVTNTGSAPLWHARDAVDIRPTSVLATLDSAYVAVMTDGRTASSGEAVTISFRGRPRTRSFGLATAGLSTANSGFKLPDGGMIFLTTSVEADRNGKRYGEKIQPDEVVAAPPNGGDDMQLAAATAWLKAQPSCPR